MQEVVDKAVSKAVALSARGRSIDERVEDVMQVVTSLREISTERKKQLLTKVRLYHLLNVMNIAFWTSY